MPSPPSPPSSPSPPLRTPSLVKSPISSSGFSAPPPSTPSPVTRQGYAYKRHIKTGGFARIYLATDKSTGADVAVKHFIDLSALGQHYVAKCLANELTIVKAVKHPNLMGAIEIIQTPTEAFIFMAFCAKGSINDLLYYGVKCPLSESKTQGFARDILRGLTYLHLNRIAHRDLKLDNFLLDDTWKVLITDFGFSIIVPETEERKGKDDPMLVSFEPLYVTSVCGTPDYLAPELNLIALEKRRYEVERVPEAERIEVPYDGKAADMFSFGVCLFEMLNRAKPYTETSTKSQKDGPVLDGHEAQYRLLCKQMDRKYRFTVDLKLSRPAIETVHLCLSPHPRDRPSARLLLASNWMGPRSRLASRFSSVAYAKSKVKSTVSAGKTPGSKAARVVSSPIRKPSTVASRPRVSSLRPRSLAKAQSPSKLVKSRASPSKIRKSRASPSNVGKSKLKSSPK